MQRHEVKIGNHVIFTDSHRRQHSALLTAVWGGPPESAIPENPPAVNLVYVVDDETRDDPYGRQIERETSVVHRMFNSAGGNCWHLPDE